MIKLTVTFALLISIAVLTSCEPSGTARQEMEKFNGTPTPTLAPMPTEAPIDPSEVVQVDTSQDGPALSVNGDQQKKTLDCTKYNLVMINGDSSEVTISGACQKVTVNGDGNQITADASVEFVLNGSENKITYSRFPNGKRPIVTENLKGNTIEHVSASTTKTASSKGKNVK